jgi:hypothetical protein
MTPLLLIALAAATPDAPEAPSPGALAAAIRAGRDASGPVSFRIDAIRSLHCRAFEEDPTEYLCRFRARAIDGRWRRHSAIVALDRQGWLLLSLD